MSGERLVPARQIPDDGGLSPAAATARMLDAFAAVQDGNSTST